MTLTIREAEAKAWDENRIFLELKKRYDPREWAVLAQVRNMTGYQQGRRERYADALALNCWSSRGMELHGFEFKSSRSDLLRELRDPGKADSGIYAYCDRWWLVVGHLGLIKRDELPVTWGLMAPKQGSLAVRIKAPKLEPKELDRRFVASVLRSIQQQVEPQSIYDKGFKAGALEGYKEGREAGIKTAHTNASYETKKGLKALEDQEAFKKAAGLEWGHYDWGQIGHIVAFLRGRSPALVLQSAKRLMDNAANWSKGLEAAIKEAKELEKVTKAIREGKPLPKSPPKKRRKKRPAC
jgi:hypothetical protein